MSILSDEQFAAQVNDTGASRSLKTGAQAAQSGYYLSTPKYEEKHDGPVSADDVRAHRERILKDRSTGYQGGWNDNGTRYLDHSIHVTEFSNAAMLARHWKQKSLYDADNDSYHSGGYFTRGRGPKSLQRVAKAAHGGTPG